MPLTVKICGVRTPEAALAAAEAGADMIGLMFAPSRRQIEVAAARKIVEALRASSHGRDVVVVGVFVDEQPARIAEIAAAARLDWVQLSGHEAVAVADALDLPTIKAVRFDGDPSESGWIAASGDCASDPLLVDAHVPGSFGGAGVVGDWAAAARLAVQRPVLLAGGLTPLNVAEAIRVVQPWGVDVSSGVETDGAKDLDKIRAFVRAAKAGARRDTAPDGEHNSYGIIEGVDA